MRLLRDPRLTIAVSLVLGGTFLYSSWHKIADPPDFAHVILNYKLVPAGLINSVAIYMPWLEVFAGLAVVTSLGRRGGALGLGLMCLLFIGALSFNLYRGHPTICGCFDTFAEGNKLTEPEKFFRMKRELLLDAGLLLLSFQILYATSREGEQDALAAAGPTASSPR